MSSKYFGTVLYNEGANDENIMKQIQISLDNVPLNSNEVGHFEILCVEWRKNIALIVRTLRK